MRLADGGSAHTQLVTFNKASLPTNNVSFEGFNNLGLNIMSRKGVQLCWEISSESCTNYLMHLRDNYYGTREVI